MKRNRSPEVSVIIPCYNEERTIQQLLQAIYDQTYPTENLEVIIADGQSTDRTRVRIEGFVKAHSDLTVKVIDNPKRTIPAAVNLAVGTASAEFIIRMDAHSVPDRNYVKLCIDSIRSGKGDCVGGVWEIQPGGEGWQARSISVAAAHPLGVGDALYRYTNNSGEVDTVPFGSFRKTLFDQLGGFNEELLSNEDYEFYSRLKKQGGKVWLDPAIRSVYYARHSFKELARQYWRYGFWKFRMLIKYPETLRWRQALPPLYLIALVLLLMATLIYSPSLYLLISIIGIYSAVLIFTGALLALKRKDLGLVFGVPIAIATMHMSWGAGFLYSMIIKILNIK